MGITHNFTGDPLSASGYWAPQTSAANFCEMDYNVSYYIAEFINTLSNLAYIWQAIITLPSSQRGGGREFALWKWPVSNLALVLVGLGSGAFHLTLLHEAQIVDESGMYAIVGALDYSLWTYGASQYETLSLGLLLSGAVFGVIGWNFTQGDGGADTAVHLVLFIALLTALWPRALYMIKKQSRERREASGLKGKDEVAGKLMREFKLGVVYFFSGFGLWLIDGGFCHGLRGIRAMISMPLAWLLEFHGWWHLLTAMGAGQFVWVARELTKPSKTSKAVANGRSK
jgi:dihydroceramidase